MRKYRYIGDPLSGVMDWSSGRVRVGKGGITLLVRVSNGGCVIARGPKMPNSIADQHDTQMLEGWREGRRSGDGGRVALEKTTPALMGHRGSISGVPSGDLTD